MRQRLARLIHRLLGYPSRSFPPTFQEMVLLDRDRESVDAILTLLRHHGVPTPCRRGAVVQLVKDALVRLDERDDAIEEVRALSIRLRNACEVGEIVTSD